MCFFRFVCADKLLRTMFLLIDYSIGHCHRTIWCCAWFHTSRCRLTRLCICRCNYQWIDHHILHCHTAQSSVWHSGNCGGRRWRCHHLRCDDIVVCEIHYNCVVEYCRFHDDNDIGRFLHARIRYIALGQSFYSNNCFTKFNNVRLTIYRYFI